MRQIFIYSLLLIFIACKSSKQADTIIHHAVIYTVDSAFSIAEAMVVKDGKILATGKSDDLLKTYTAKETIDAQGKAVYPGFIDAHAHFLGYGQSLFQVSLFGCTSWDEVVERVKDFAAKHPNEPWIKGRGWDQNKWPGKAFPSNEKLNALFPNKPVFLTRVDGHAAVANQKALDIANVTVGQTLTGGEVEVKNGKLTGVLIDNAKGLVIAKMPVATKADYEKWLLAAQQNCFAQGLTPLQIVG